MFDSAAAGLIATTTACAAAVLGVFAAGFALYALATPSWGPAGAAAAVAAAAALVVGALALIAHHRAKAKQREAEIAQAQLVETLPLGLGVLARDHPLVALGLTLAGGALAARHPRLSRDLIAIIARFTGR